MAHHITYTFWDCKALFVTRIKQLVKTLVDTPLTKHALLVPVCMVELSFTKLMLCCVVCVQGQGEYVSYWAHLGGFVCGLFPSFFFLPNLKDKRYGSAT